MKYERKTFWLDRPVLVTGATGLLGGWLVKELIASGADVLCIIRDRTPKSEMFRTSLLDKVQVIWGDVRDQDLMERALGEYEIVTLFHLAAQTTVGTANRNPVSTLDTNIRGTWTVLEAARRSPLVKQIVTASSDKAYGDQPCLPYTESMPMQGMHPYDVSKSCADLLCRSYAQTYALPVCVTRCGNFYGGGDLNWNRIVPGTIRSVIRNERPIIRSDGKYLRDYLYVEDGAAAYLWLAEQMESKPEIVGEAFNFSTGEPISVIDMVTRILSIMGSSLEPDIRNEASNEIREQSLDSTKAASMLDWRPRFTLQDGLAATVSWYEDYFKAHA